MSIYKVYNIHKRVTPYQRKKCIAQGLARDWQQANTNKSHSWAWVCSWFLRWERIGKKYGLLREFRENGIL